MSLQTELYRYTCLDWTYDVNANPTLAWSKDHANIVNCQSFIHSVYHGVLGIRLPLGLWSQEFYEDRDFFYSVADDVLNNLQNLRLADIFLFGRQHNTNPKLLHLGLFSGEFRENNPLIVHANMYDKGVGVWPLTVFSQYLRYEKIFDVKRLYPKYLPPTLNRDYIL